MVVIVTDAQYRMTLPIVRSLGEAGFETVCVSMAGSGTPVGFYSKWCSASHVLDGGEGYVKALSGLCATYVRDGMKPVLLPVGGKTCDAISANAPLFGDVCALLLSSPEVLYLANDKGRLLEEAKKAGVPVPAQYTKANAVFPCVIKYRCGEKLNITAANRYAILRSKRQLQEKLEEYIQHDKSPLLQEYLAGEGVGVSVLMDREGTACDFICHRRLREYPASGGPSSLCESFFDDTLVESAVKLLRHIGFVGVAMVEFKADANGVYKLMEINPRVWGSFALTRAAGSRFAENWARLSAGEKLPPAGLVIPPYKPGARMQFLPSEVRLAVSSPKKAAGILGDILSPKVRDGVFETGDIKGGLGYIKSMLFRR